MSRIMLEHIEPAADKIWMSAGYVLTLEGEENLAPTTEEGWNEVAMSATLLMDSPRLMIAAATDPDDEEWREFSLALGHAAKLAQTAALEKDEDRLFAAGGTIYQVCRACHLQYWKENPVR